MVEEQVVRVSHAGLSAWCNGYRARNNGLVFLSIFGVQAAVKAIWAALSGRRTSVEVDESWVRLLDDGKYTTLRSITSRQWLHLVMIHTDATSVVSPFVPEFFVVGEDPKTIFWPRFNRMCPVPMRQSWGGDMWRIGEKEGLISPLNGFGLPGSSVRVGEEWAAVVQKAILAGELR